MLHLNRLATLLAATCGLALAGASCAESNEDAGGAGGTATTDTVTAASSGSKSGSTSPSSSSNTASVATTDAASSTADTSGSTEEASSSVAESSSSTGLMMLPNYEPETEPNDDFMNMGNPLPPGQLGFVGSLSHGNDNDAFTFQGVAGNSMHIAISDGMGGCPIVGTSMLLQLFNPSGTEIASKFEACPVLDNDVDVANLPTSGEYTIRVSGLAPTPWYALEIGVLPVECGNGVRQVGETCDDGNLTPGDGCDASCQVELPGGSCSEIEPNGLVGQATPLVGCAWGVGSSANGSDIDFFSFEVPAAGNSVRVEIFDPSGVGCPSGFGGELKLYNPSNALVETTTSSSACPKMLPAAEPGATNLVAGTYKVSFDPSGAGAYAMKVTVLPPSCGDGIVQTATEDCDDGNTTNGDNCDSTCQWEGNICPEVEPNNSAATANPTTGCLYMAGQISVIGDADFYQIPITIPGSKLVLRTYDVTGTGCTPNFDSHIYLYGPAGNLIVDDDDDSPDGVCSLINPTLNPEVGSLAAGVYTVSVREHVDDEIDQPYFLYFEVTPPACGDGTLQSGEECDDGNLTNGDGCSDACVIEGVFCTEAEPNNTQATATPLAGACSGRGAILPVGDLDRYSFTVVNANTTATIEVTDGLGGCPAGFDSFLRLYGTNGMEIATDDDTGVDICSKIVRPGLAAGSYTFEVSERGNNQTTPFYIVKLTLN